MTQTNRLSWIDGLRTTMVLLVINMHACVTYSHIGSWYFMVSPEPGMGEKIPFAFWQGHLQSFFMGLLFFVAGHFADRSLKKKGAKAFTMERLKRLGIPTLIYMLLIHPFIVFGMLTPFSERPSPSQFVTQYIISGDFISGSGPMWFAFALLLFCFGLVVIERCRPTEASRQLVTLKPVVLVGIAMGLGILSFLVRLWQPLGTSILNFQFCYFAQYIVVFGLGVWVSTRDALEPIASSTVACRSGWLGVILGPATLACFAILAAHDLGMKPPPMNGGLNWEALALATWEQCTGMCLGLGCLALCWRFLNKEHKWLDWLSDRSFGMYLFHAPLLVGIAIWLQRFHGNVILMSLLLTVLGWVISAFVADVARRIQLLRRVI